VESESDFFVRLRLRMSSWIILYIKLLNWEFLLKYGTISFETFVETDFLLCTTISIDLAAKFHSLCVKESESESEILERSESEIVESRSWIFYLRLRNPAANS